MQVKYTAALLVAAAVAVFYLAWEHSPEPVLDASTPLSIGPGETPAHDPAMPLALLERRLALIEERLQRLESRQPAGSSSDTALLLMEEIHSRLSVLERDSRRHGDLDVAEAFSEPMNRISELIAQDDDGSPGSPGQQIRQAYLNDDNAEPIEQADLESAASIFQHEALGDLTFRQMDCREHYCRLSYDDYSSDSAAAGLIENILFVQLVEKYGENVIIHGGERSGTSRTLYVEMSGSR